MPAYNFQRQFVKMIIDGQKPHTIRRRRKHPTKVGDVLKLFVGMRTKNCRQFAEAVCTAVEPITIYPWDIKIENEQGYWMNWNELRRLAHRDGFDNLDGFFIFFRRYQKERLDDFEIIWWDPKTLKVMEVQGG